MKKIICLLLTLMLTLSLACPALAATNSPSKPTTTPATGDTIMPFVIMMVVALVALAAVAVFSRKHFKKA